MNRRQAILAVLAAMTMGRATRADEPMWDADPLMFNNDPPPDTFWIVFESYQFLGVRDDRGHEARVSIAEMIEALQEPEPPGVIRIKGDGQAWEVQRGE